MHKIYSRPRIKIPNIKIKGIPPDKLTKRKKLATMTSILAIAFGTVYMSLKAVSPTFDTLCENRAKSIATMISNEQATVIMNEHSYDELFTIEKDNNGNITMIKSNVIPINAIISDVAIKIQEQIDQKGRENIEIASGTFTGLKLLAGRGPGVKIRISSVGSVETDFRSEFTSQGINQTLHRVYLQVKCSVNILTPFKDIERDITNQVLLAENVIVGNIPSTYYNLEGMENTMDSMEVIQ